MKEFTKATGKVTYELRDSNGKLKLRKTYKNLVVTAGKNALAAWLAAASQATPFMRYVAIGSGSTAPTSGDTTLGTELARVLGTLSASTNVLQNQATFAAGTGTGALQEAGLFDAVSSGNMFSRQTFSVINKGAGDSLTVTWQVTFS